jgi:hypothetical protein
MVRRGLLGRLTVFVANKSHEPLRPEDFYFCSAGLRSTRQNRTYKRKTPAWSQHREKC